MLLNDKLSPWMFVYILIPVVRFKALTYYQTWFIDYSHSIVDSYLNTTEMNFDGPRFSVQRCYTTTAKTV